MVEIKKPKHMSEEKAIAIINAVLLEHCEEDIFLSRVEITVDRVYRTRYDCSIAQG